MKRERCDHCGKMDGDKCPDGRMLLVLHLGCCPKAKLCTACLALKPEVHRHDDESLAAWVKRQHARELRDLQPVVEHLSRSVGGFDPFATRVPFTFVDPLEQLELGRLRTLPVYVTGVEIVEGVLR